MVIELLIYILIMLVVIALIIDRPSNSRSVSKIGYGKKPTTSRPKVRPRPQPK
jgi:hypothetical protein